MIWNDAQTCKTAQETKEQSSKPAKQTKCVHEWHLLRSRQRSALSTELSLSWLKRSVAVNTRTKYTATE